MFHNCSRLDLNSLKLISFVIFAVKKASYENLIEEEVIRKMQIWSLLRWDFFVDVPEGGLGVWGIRGWTQLPRKRKKSQNGFKQTVKNLAIVIVVCFTEVAKNCTGTQIVIKINIHLLTPTSGNLNSPSAITPFWSWKSNTSTTAESFVNSNFAPWVLRCKIKISSEYEQTLPRN